MKSLRTHRHRPRVDLRLVAGLLGGLIACIGLTLLLPALVGIGYGESSWMAFAGTATLSVAGGAVLFTAFPPHAELRLREAFLLVTLAWVVASLLGAVPFVVSGTLHTYTDAVFETASGFTTTGATILGGTASNGVPTPAIEALDKSLLFWRSLTHWLGGMGIIVLTLALLPLLGIGGMQLYKAEYSGSTEDKLTPRIRETAKLLWGIYVGMTAALTLLLWAHPSMDWFEAVNHAFSTMATGGFSTRNDSIAGFDSVYIDGVIIVFMALAGINFALHFRLFTGDLSRVRANPELRFYGSLLLLFSLAISLGLWALNGYAFGDALRYGVFQVVSLLTTTGFGTDDYVLWAPLPAFLLFLLFFSGGCAGSTGGGLKMIRLLIILKNIRREFQQLVHPQAVLPLRLGTRVVDRQILKHVLGFLVMYLLTFLLGALAMTGFGYDFMSAMGASIASLGNIGPAWGAFGPAESYAEVPYLGKWLLSFLMILGRLELFTVLVLFAPYFWKT